MHWLGPFPWGVFFINHSILVVVTLSAVAVSALVDRKRTARGLKKGGRMLLRLLPQFAVMLVLASVFLTLMPQDLLARLLGPASGRLGPLVAALFGSVTIMPGPIAYPLAGMLRDSGVPMTTLAVFVTTLMMVGVLTFPVERAYLGTRIAVLRNALSLIGALLIGWLVGVVL